MNSALKRMGGVAASLVVTAGLVSGISVVVSTTAEARNTMVTATTNVNVRSGPSTDYRVLGSIRTGQSLPVRGEGRGGWTQVSYSGGTGWISSDYVVGNDDSTAGDAKESRGWRYGTTALNVRTGPSLSAGVVDVAGKGYGFQITGPTENGYSEVNFKGKVRWVTSRYLTEKKPGGSDGAEEKSPSKSSGWRYATTALNVRTDPSLNSRVVDVAGKGYGFTFHGTERNGFAEVTFQGNTRWVSARYLTEKKPSAPKREEEPKQSEPTWRYATVALNVRTDPSLSSRVVDVAGPGYGFILHGTRGDFSKVTFRGETRWVTARYLSARKPSGSSAGPSGSSLPEVTGTRYATAPLNIRSASRGGTTSTVAAAGTKLSITGKVEHGRAQVVYENAVRWVTAQYLSKSAPNAGAGSSGGGSSSGIAGLTPNSKYLMARLQARYPQVNTYYGVRPDTIPDHPSGRALDAMLPSYTSSSSQELGREMAEWIKDNAAELNVEYIIFNQRIWNVRRSGEGWRYMADRGSDNANHKNHVHITTFN